LRRSISGKHGIGEEKKACLSISCTLLELALKGTLEAAPDRLGLLNPGQGP
jgi:hypothetical protein